MTELAYLASMDGAYTRSFRARVVARPPGGVVLDRTFFYPTGGGQPNDLGTLRAPGAPIAADVVDVVKQGSTVVHRLSGAAPVRAGLAVGTEVEATIDWARRERHMRLHTSQHYLSARIFARYGARTRHASLRGREAVIELDRALPTRAIEELGEDAASMASDPRHVRIREVPRVEWDRHPTARSSLVALAPGVDPVRLIEIEGIDLCPCGGTHVRSTSEVGELEIRPVSERDEGGTRFSYVLVNGGGTTPPE